MCRAPNETASMNKERKPKPPRGPRGLEHDAAASALVEACCRVGKYQPHDMLRWLVDDILGSMGLPVRDPAPADTHGWLRTHSGHYADLVARFPFQDVLGFVYQELASRGHRKALGQFFTPGSVAELLAALAAPALDKLPNDRLLRACEPACGNGAMILAFIATQLRLHGREALKRWSISAIDLDPTCARICAAQVLSNLCLQRLDLGELVVYRGNALGRWEKLDVVVHATVRDLTADTVLPAMHPSRLSALRDASGRRQQEPDKPDRLIEETRRSAELPTQPDGWRELEGCGPADTMPINLFAD